MSPTKIFSALMTQFKVLTSRHSFKHGGTVTFNLPVPLIS